MRYLLVLVVITVNVMTSPLQAEERPLTVYEKNKNGESFSAIVWRKKGIFFRKNSALSTIVLNAHAEEIIDLQIFPDRNLVTSISSKSLKIWTLGIQEEKINKGQWGVTAPTLKFHFQGEFKKGDKVVFLFTGNEVAVYGLRGGKLHKQVFDLKKGKNQDQ